MTAIEKNLREWISHTAFLIPNQFGLYDSIVQQRQYAWGLYSKVAMLVAMDISEKVYALEGFCDESVLQYDSLNDWLELLEQAGVTAEEIEFPSYLRNEKNWKEYGWEA